MNLDIAEGKKNKLQGVNAMSFLPITLSAPQQDSSCTMMMLLVSRRIYHMPRSVVSAPTIIFERIHPI